MSLALPVDPAPEAAMIVETVDGLAAELVAPAVAEIDDRGEVPADILDALSDQGLMAAGVSELSGEQVEPVYGLLVVSRLARASAAVGSVVAAVHDGAAAFGDRDRLRGRSADWVPAVVPQRVNAASAGEELVLHGCHPRVELAGENGSLVVIAGREDGGGVVVELDQLGDGVVIGDRERTTGLRGRTFASVELAAVRVAPDQVIGGPAEAERARTTRDLTTAALGLGIALGSLEAADRYAGERRQFGAALRSFPAVRGHLLEMEQQVATVSALLWAAARREAVGQGERLPALRAARAAIGAARIVPRLAVQVLGGYGFIDEYPVERRMRDGMSIIARAGGLEALSAAAAPPGSHDVAVAR